MNNQIEQDTKEAFNAWLYEACRISLKDFKLQDSQDIYSRINLADAKLAYIDGMSSEEYSKEIKNLNY